VFRHWCVADGQRRCVQHREPPRKKLFWRRLSASRSSVAASTDNGVLRSIRSMVPLASRVAGVR